MFLLTNISSKNFGGVGSYFFTSLPFKNTPLLRGLFFNIWGKGVDVWVRSQRSTASVDQLITMHTCMSKISIPGRNVLLLYIALHRMARASLYGHLCSKLLARVSTRQGHSCLISCIWLSNLTIPCHCFTIHKYRPVSVH